MKRISNKRAALMRIYSKKRKLFMEAHKMCAVCKRRQSKDIHHQRGREGELLVIEEFWLPVCRTCHDKIHAEPKWAEAHGFYSTERNKPYHANDSGS